MSIKYDYWDGDASTDNALSIDATTDWGGQTFTASNSYYVTSVQLWCAKTAGADIGTVTVSIKATDASGHPFGSDLVSGTQTSANIPPTTAYAWVEFTFTTGVNLNYGTKYAIVARASNAATGRVFFLVFENDNPYSGGAVEWSTNSGSTWATSGTYDLLFRVYGGTPTVINKRYSRRLVAIGNNEVWYESTAGTMVELSAANGQINCGDLLNAIEAYQKIFIANGTVKKVIDFVNTKIATADVKPTDKVIPLKGDTLTGGTSGATMIVDYIDASDATCNVYGYRTSVTTFTSGETVTGTNTNGNISFTTSAAETAPPQWYSWTIYSADATTYGTMPSSTSLIALYRGRIVFNDDQNPHAWYMTKVGNPWKILYDYTNDGDLSAVAHTNTKVGEIGDIITAIIAYKDDFIIFGCANSVWILVGDPLGSGQLARITNATGIWGAKSWCIDDKSNLYFLGEDGIYRMPISESYSSPENISKMPLPNLITTLDLDKLLHRVVLGFDPIKNGILISKTLLSDGTNTNFWFDLSTQGFYPESYPASCGIFSMYYYPATDDTYKKFLIGCQDGYIREFDNSTKSDATTSSTSAIDSYFTIVQRLGADQNTEGKMIWLNGVTAGGAVGGTFGDTDSVTYLLYTGKDAELVLEDIKDDTTFANYWITGIWSGTGKQTKNRVRMRGCWYGLVIRNAAASESYGINDIYCVIVQAGKLQS